MRAKPLVICLLTFVLASCYDIKEEMILNRDGSGVYQITVLMHDSAFAQMKANDSLGMLNSLKKDLQKEKDRLFGISGIQNVTYDIREEGKIIRIGFEFKTVAALNQALVSELNPARFYLEKNIWKIEGGLPRIFNLSDLGADTSANSRYLEHDLFQNSHYTSDILVMGKIKSTGNKLAKNIGNRIILNCDLNAILDNKKTNAMKIKFK